MIYIFWEDNYTISMQKLSKDIIQILGVGDGVQSQQVNVICI